MMMIIILHQVSQDGPLHLFPPYSSLFVLSVSFVWLLEEEREDKPKWSTTTTGSTINQSIHLISQIINLSILHQDNKFQVTHNLHGIQILNLISTIIINHQISLQFNRILIKPINQVIGLDFIHQTLFNLIFLFKMDILKGKNNKINTLIYFFCKIFVKYNL